MANLKVGDDLTTNQLGTAPTSVISPSKRLATHLQNILTAGRCPIFPFRGTSITRNDLLPVENAGPDDRFTTAVPELAVTDRR